MSNYNLKNYSDDDLCRAVVNRTVSGCRSEEDRNWRSALLEEYKRRRGAESADALLSGALNIAGSWS